MRASVIDAGGLSFKDPKSLWDTDEPWLKKAWKEIGQAEIPGIRNNPRIIFYHSFCTLRAALETVSWCSAFMCFIFGLKFSTKSAAARSWIDWRYGIPLDIEAIIPRGALLVFRSAKGPGFGHTAFYLADAGTDHYWVLGGNQGDAVSIAKWPKADLIAALWPKGDVRDALLREVA